MFGRKNEDDEQVDPGKAVEAKFGEVNTKISDLEGKVVTKEEFKKTQENVDFIATELRAAKEAKEKAAKDKAAKEQKPYDPQAAFEEFAENPAQAMANANAPALRMAAIANSKLLRQELLGHKQFYDNPEFRKAVNEAIDSGTDRNDTLVNPQYINNCYKVVLADFMEAGKLDEMREAAAKHSLADGGNSGKSGRSDENAKPEIKFRDQTHFTSDKAKFAQKQLGLTDEDLIEAANSGEIKGLEVVA